MDEVLQFIYDFILMFLLIFIVYAVFVNKKKKKKGFSKLKNTDEVVIFVSRYNLDVELIGYKKILNVMALVNSIIIAFTCTIIVKIKSILWSILVSFVLIFVLIYSLFEISGRILKKVEERKKCITQKK